MTLKKLNLYCYSCSVTHLKFSIYITSQHTGVNMLITQDRSVLLGCRSINMSEEYYELHLKAKVLFSTAQNHEIIFTVHFIT